MPRLTLKPITVKPTRRLFVGRLAAISLALAASLAISGQTPSPTPTPNPDVTWNGYTVTATSEVGFRWQSVSGSQSKYRSDLNYKQGFRLFDSNILLESESGKGKYFDSLLVSSSGWGSDPTGFTRVNVEKAGIYKFNATVRRIVYFNDLVNHALNEHNRNTSHYLGDFDMVLRPQDEKFRVKLGASFSDSSGSGGYTTRAYSDEFPIISDLKSQSQDFRAGVEGKLWGFDYGLTQGFRLFKDHGRYTTIAPNPGNNPVGTAALATFTRDYPVTGNGYYTQFNAHRTFADAFDFTARLIYSSTSTTSQMSETITGRDNTNNIVDLDRFSISGNAKRPQTRGDLGFTWMATKKFRISNTFSFDTFAVNGGNAFEELLVRRNAGGTPLANTLTQTAGYRVNDYRRIVNTLEADYQVNDRIAFHVGYRFTHRNVEVAGFDLTRTSAPSATNPVLISEEEANSTNTLLAGMKIKPLKNWVIFWDVEHGSADNVFTRVENYHFTNIRARTRFTIDKFSLNASVITKDNDNPSKPTDIQPLAFDTSVNNRFYSGSLDWDPVRQLSISAGYTYHHLTSLTPIVVPVAGVYKLGFSEFFMRDRYAFIDVAARPIDRLSFFASYRLSRDKGQGNLSSTVVQNIITSYPMQFATPEFRMAVRLTRNIDWNLGYQYYDYRDTQTPQQNYRAHLPFTSLRFYWGKNALDR